MNRRSLFAFLTGLVAAGPAVVKAAAKPSLMDLYDSIPPLDPNLMFPSHVNDAFQELMAETAKWRALGKPMPYEFKAGPFSGSIRPRTLA